MSAQIEDAQTTTARRPKLADEADRRVAMQGHDRSLLVEAGAGSGKTALMAGRIALMLARGIQPKNIAAVTFTELAASELLFRVRELVAALLAGDIPVELRLAVQGLSAAEIAHLTRASEALDEITCSTIHGFCQRLIKPYPVEADIDPGATVMDNNQADLTFHEITQSWLRRELDAREGTLLTEMVLASPHETVRLVEEILGHLRRHRRLTVAPAMDPGPLLASFQRAVAHFRDFVESAAGEPDTKEIVAHFESLADALKGAMPQAPADLVRMLQASPPEALTRQDGAFCAYRKATKWKEAAKRAGLSKIDGERLAQSAEEHYARACEAWEALREATASGVLGLLVKEVAPVVERFRQLKRRTALLDFNDLIFAARDLLRDHEPVRAALARRFSHVLVDEFQDTDPLQTEIFWRLCGEPAEGDWTRWKIRPGALFLVGDPKQAIYRFRGADVEAYVQARKALHAQDPAAVLSISTNFRSRAPILTYVNERFREPLSEARGQPGFTELKPHLPDKAHSPCVAALDIAVPGRGDDEKPSGEQLRDAEAQAVADLCARLIGGHALIDRRSGQIRPCRPGDIALLAPTGKDLWRYEAALEDRGIAVATQAGKGLYRRQEIQDLIALTRVLADTRDTLALGALLRGPLVGLSEQELLDILWSLPAEKPGELPRLTLRTAPEQIPHPLAKEILQTLRALRRNVNGTTPHDLLSQACAQLRVRPILMQRHRDQAERALANVDLYLDLSRAYAVRGLRAFAEAMTQAWSDESRAGEGRPDAQEEAVALFTMHASKGLEWPIVIPINTMTVITPAESAITDRGGTFHCPVFHVRPSGYGIARDAEKDELTRERIRLWYVATTRARELLVLPRLDVPKGKPTWMDLLPLREDLPGLNLDELPLIPRSATAAGENTQTRETFSREAEQIFKLRRSIHWVTPSREDESQGGDTVLIEEQAEIRVALQDSAPKTPTAPEIQGGRERGMILHKLLEEVLTGETQDTPGALEARAMALIAEMAREDVVAEELAGCVQRTLALSEVAALRPRLKSEFHVCCASGTPAEEQVATGIADCIAFDSDGQPEVIIDWKSDVSPDIKTLEHYRKQVEQYLKMTGAHRGLIILVTTGTIIPVSRT